jgi:hypothetical protein
MDVSASSPSLVISCIVSGGQTGVDRAALDAAIELGLDHGGWCPRGRRAEDGAIDPTYRLRETRSAKYHVRTRRNVLDSDGTLIISCGELSGGTELTLRVARRYGKPAFVVELPEADVEEIRRWLAEHRIQILNVAGPRESTSPGVYRFARSLLRAVLTSV